MIDVLSARKELETKTDLEWFDMICELLKKIYFPTTKLFNELLGIEKNNPTGEIRGGKLLIPFDDRFNWCWISPNLSENSFDKPLDSLSIGGGSFVLNNSDIIERFPDFQKRVNTYDGGTQFFFYPVSDVYEFTALDFWTDRENSTINNNFEIVFNSVTFEFGDRLTDSRTGYGMKR